MDYKPNIRICLSQMLVSMMPYIPLFTIATQVHLLYIILHLAFHPPKDGMNILHCAAINNHTDIVEYIINDLHMKELDKDDKVST